MSTVMNEIKSGLHFLNCVDCEYENTDIEPNNGLAFRHDIVDWCIRNAQRYLDQNMFEECLRWDLLAGRTASFDCAPLSSPMIESHLVEIAARLPVPMVDRCPPPPGNGRWLHVINEAFPVGGHTAMAARWMALDPDHSKHSVMLLGQRAPVPASLSEAAEHAGGDVISLDPEAPFIERAIRLREYAWQEADVIVLHIDVCDVIAMTALSIPGGPPVLLVNHAAHIFWIGCSMADLVLNCRGSALEHLWTVRHRGIEDGRSMTLPIPLPVVARKESRIEAELSRKTAKEALKLPSESLVVLTVGSTFKYSPLPGIDFLEVVTQILLKRHDVYLLAVGMEEDGRWQAARLATGGRLLAVGYRQDVPSFHAAADVYIEGFPFGSTTALLEAGLQGIPCVLAPAICPPPFGSDGPAVDVLKRPADLEEYANHIMLLLGDKHERVRIGQLLAASIYCHHCEAGWGSYLKDVKRNLPARHKIHALYTAPPVPENNVIFWSTFSDLTRIDPLVDVFRNAIRLGLKPFLDKKLRRALIEAKSFRKHYHLIDILALITGPLSSVLPYVTSSDTYLNLFHFFRPRGRIMRLITKTYIA